MKVLVACEFSGIVRDAFAAKGHDAWSCDLLPTEQEGNHIQGDVLKILDDSWDLMIAHPPCTYLTLTGNRWFKEEYESTYPTRKEDREDAVNFFMALANAPIEHICIENPAGIMTSRWKKPTQYIQPYNFGEPHAKRTGLWLKNLLPLAPTLKVKPKYYDYKDGSRTPYWHYETVHLPPEERMKARSRTFPGIANAMAIQWNQPSPRLTAYI